MAVARSSSGGVVMGIAYLVYYYGCMDVVMSIAVSIVDVLCYACRCELIVLKRNFAQLFARKRRARWADGRRRAVA